MNSQGGGTTTGRKKQVVKLDLPLWPHSGCLVKLRHIVVVILYSTLLDV